MRRTSQIGLALLLAAVALGVTLPAANARAGHGHASDRRERGSVSRIGIRDARALGHGRCFGRAARRARIVRRRCAGRRRPTAKGPAGPLYWGATIGDQLTGTQAPWDMSAVSRFEDLTHKSPSLMQFFQPFSECGSSCKFLGFPLTPMEDIREHGSIPILSWSSQSIPSSLDEPEFQLSDVIEGHYDDQIRGFATEARKWGHPFFLRFNWEMNGNWFPWAEGVNGNQAGQYVAAWRHVHDIFTAVGATNVSWVWCPNIEWNGTVANIASMYPGDEYVDWTGLDGYNWGASSTSSRGWRSFGQLFGGAYRQITESVAPSKPLMIAETGSSENGGSKAAWIAEALTEIPLEYPQVKALVWFDKFDDGMDWPIETSTSAADAFAQGIKSAAYLPASYAGLSGGAIQPPS